MAIGCFIKVGREEEEDELCSVLRRTLDVLQPFVVIMGALWNASGSSSEGLSLRRVLQ